MSRNKNLVAVVCAAASACAGLAAESRSRPVETLEASGLRTPALSVESESRLTFANADERPHEIYSPDCHELASILLRPGQRYTVALGLGPKLCHFQDLLAPVADSYSGTIEVRERPSDEFLGGE